MVDISYAYAYIIATQVQTSLKRNANILSTIMTDCFSIL